MTSAPPADAAATRAEALAGLREEFGNLLRSERSLRGRDQHRAEGELSTAHVRALFALGAHEQATAGQIAERARLTPASVTGMLDDLERDGIVTRARSDSDRRRVMVSLTDEGRELLAKRRRAWAKRWEVALADASEEEIEAARRVMRTISGLLDKI